MAGLIPRGFIADLLARVDIVEVIDAVVPLRKAGKNHQARCPFHDEKTPSFTVSQDKQFYHCFGCGAHGTVIGFLMEHGNLSFPEAVEELAGRYGLSVPHEPARAGAGRAPAASDHAELHELLELCIRYYKAQLRQHPQAARAVDYLKQRGVSGETAAAYELGYAPPGWDNLLRALGASEPGRRRLARVGMIIARDESGDSHYDRFRDRVMYPIRDRRGRAVGFGGRALGEEEKPKYLNSPETLLFHKGREVYGLHQARRRLKTFPAMYVVEGYMDVLALAQFEIHNAVATLGTAATAEHLQQLFRCSDKLVFCFDGDAAGKKAAWRALDNALPLLREGREARFLFMPEGDDPDTYIRREGAAAFLDERRHAPLSDFLLDGLKSGIADLRSREGRAKLIDAALPLINKLPRGGFRELLLKDTAALCGLEQPRLQALLEGLPGEPRRRPAVSATVRYLSPRESPQLADEMISCLLQRPSLARHVEEVESLRDIAVTGVPLLIDVLDFIHQRPEINCAGLLERWRGTAQEARLGALAKSAYIYDAKGFDIERQFQDILAGLQRKREWQEFVAISKNRGDMSAEAKDAARRLVAARSRAAPPP